MIGRTSPMARAGGLTVAGEGEGDKTDPLMQLQ